MHAHREFIPIFLHRQPETLNHHLCSKATAAATSALHHSPTSDFIVPRAMNKSIQASRRSCHSCRCGGCAAVTEAERAGPPGGSRSRSWVSAAARRAQGSQLTDTLCWSAHSPASAARGRTWSFCSAASHRACPEHGSVAVLALSNLPARSVPFSALQDAAGSSRSRCWAGSKWWRYMCFPRTKSLSKSDTDSQVIFSSSTAQPQCCRSIKMLHHIFNA